MTTASAMGTIEGGRPKLFAAGVKKRPLPARLVSKQPGAVKKGLSMDKDLSDIIGETDLFPKDAKTIDGKPTPQEDNTQDELKSTSGQPENPSYADADDGTPEAMLSPAVCLVAPDVTPDAIIPLDPADVPHPPTVDQPAHPLNSQVGATANSLSNSPVLQTLLGKPRPSAPPTNPAPAAAESVQPAVSPPPATALPGIEMAPGVFVGESSGGDTGYSVIAAAMSPGIPMPSHRVNPEGMTQMLANVRRFLK